MSEGFTEAEWGKATQSAENHRMFPSFLRTQQSKPLEFESTPSHLISLRRMSDRLKLESLRDVSVTRIGDTLSYGFPQTEQGFRIINVYWPESLEDEGPTSQKLFDVS